MVESHRHYVSELAKRERNYEAIWFSGEANHKRAEDLDAFGKR
jgi:hypothetical protein